MLPLLRRYLFSALLRLTRFAMPARVVTIAELHYYHDYAAARISARAHSMSSTTRMR